jgi:DNA-binding CsgD family transcriptional regulator
VALTPSEVKILALVRAGMRNREIARLRNTSLRTVANQIASLLRKTGADGRRALLVESYLLS